MLTLNSNLQTVFNTVSDKVNSLSSSPEITQSAAENVVDLVRQRIHVDGLDADGDAIGSYTPCYMRVRTGAFKRDGLPYKSKKNKGKSMPIGLFTKGKNKGQARPQYGLGTDTKVILTLTGGMRDDLSVQPSGAGFGIGFSSTDYSGRAVWLEEKYSKTIFALTPSEKSTAIAAAQERVNELLVNGY